MKLPDKFPIQPLGYRIVVKPFEVAVKVGGIFLPETARERPMFGVVIAIGDDVTSLSTRMAVMYGKYAGTEISHDAETYLLMREDEVLGWVSDIELAKKMIAEGV